MSAKGFRGVGPIFLVTVVLSLLTAVACGAAATATPSGDSGTAPTATAASGASTTTQPQPTSPPDSSTAVQVKQLRIAISPPVQEIVLGWMGTTTSANVQVRHFADPLVETDRFTGELIPGLATDWEMTAPDGTQWIFKLREGVPFHNGWGEFTAQDVPHSASLVTLPEAIATDTGLFRGLFGETQEELLSNIETPDDKTVVFNLIRPEASMDFIASAQQGNMFMYSKAQWDAEGLEGYQTAPSGTGSWQFVERQLGQSILFRRIEDHWRKTAEFEEFMLLRVPEASTRLAMMLAGEAHIAEVDRDLHARATDQGLKVVNSQLPSIQVAFVIGGVFQPYMPTYDPTVPALDVRVREAINRAINRDEINNILFAGAGEPHPVWGYHPSMPGWNDKWLEELDEKYGYDPERARQLIQEAGYPDGFKIKMIISSLPGLPEMIPMAEAAFNMLQDVGIQVEAEEMEWARFRSDFYRPAQTHNTIAPIRGTLRPPEVTLRFYNVSGPEGFQRIVVDKAVEDKYYQVLDSVDRAERDRILREIGDLKFDMYSEVPIVWLPGQVVVNPDVVEEFVFPGNINGPFSHVEYITPAAK